jgi:hypothetical protein
MSVPNVNFEIQVLSDKHWVVAQFATEEAQAKALADNLLQRGNHSAVRVVRDRRGADGLHKETVIQEKTATVKPITDLSLSPISEAPMCRDLADFYTAEARLTIGRLLRKYLDEVVVTPTELLHSAAELKRFGDKGALLFSAIDRVSTLQAAAAGEDAKARRDFLSKSWDGLVARARALAAKKLPVLKTLGEILKVVEGGGEEHPYLCQTVMALRLNETRSWIGKLDILLAWATEQGAAPVMALIDGIIADIVLSAQLIQDLLGFQANLGSALIQLCDLSEGKALPAKFAPVDSFTALNAVFAAGLLPQARDVLMSRVTRELGGANALSRNEPKQEYEVFVKVMHRLVGHRGVLGGGIAAEAMLHRVSRIHAHLGTITAPQALEMTLSALADNVHRVQYMLALAQSPLGAGMGALLTDQLAERVRGADHIDLWVPVRLPPPERMLALAAVNRALLTAGELEQDFRTELGNQVDNVLANYLTDEGVIEKIDKPDDPLAMRAIRLIKFCGSGVLIEGKSLNLARARVIEHLRQPQFEEKFLASVPEPGKAELHLREFHRLLVQTGFR